MSRRDPVARIGIYKHHCAFSISAVDMFPILNAGPGYMGVFYNKLFGIVKLVFRTNYEEGDAKFRRNGAQVQSACKKIQHLLNKPPTAVKFELVRDMQDPNVGYFGIPNKTNVGAREKLIKLSTGIINQNDLLWEKLTVGVRNDRVDILNVTLVFGKESCTAGLKIYNFQFEYFKSLLGANSLYFDLCEDLQKVCIKKNHPFSYGGILTTVHPENKPPHLASYFGTPTLNAVISYYGVDPITVDTKLKALYFKMIPHPQEDEVYVIDTIYASRACRITNGECEE